MGPEFESLWGHDFFPLPLFSALVSCSRKGLACFRIVFWRFRLGECLVGACFLLVVPGDAVGVVELVEPADSLADSVRVVEVEPGVLEDGEGLVDDAAHVVHGEVGGLFFRALPHDGPLVVHAGLPFQCGQMRAVWIGGPVAAQLFEGEFFAQVVGVESLPPSICAFPCDGVADDLTGGGEVPFRDAFLQPGVDHEPFPAYSADELILAV